MYFIIELPENTSINEHVIEIVKGKQPLYSLIYSLVSVKLEILKTYIKIYLKTGFIQSSKFSADAPIFFDQKRDKSLCFDIDYWGLNNLIIKNRYPLLRIGEALNKLVWAK